MRTDIRRLLDKKREGVPITMVTAYDCPTARLLDEAGIDSILVGDSLGTNVLGYASEREVTMDDMTRHTAAVKRAAPKAFVIADLPYGCADNAADALHNAKILTAHGADCVKIEGWGEIVDIIRHLDANKITVCAHIGYNPQIHDRPRIFGKDSDQAEALLDSAVILQNAGASLIVLEMTPKKLSGVITEALTIPTIGIGSGSLCDGQVLVVNDLLGLSPKIYKHARAFADLRGTMLGAFKDYAEAVRNGSFPEDANQCS